MIYGLIALAILALAFCIVAMTHINALRAQTCMMMIAATVAYMATGMTTGDMAAACMILISGILGALVLDGYSFQPKVKYGVVMA